jgi:putative ABC transport system ATP-binding protein
MLEMSGIRKVYRTDLVETHALEGLSLKVEDGEFVSVMGPSGSGKTTFLSILGCILTPSSGEVVVDGRQVDAKRLADIRKRSLGFVFQQFNLFPSLTAIENVEYALNVKGVRGGDARREADRVIEAVGLAERKHFLPRDLSGGQKQRVAIARALAGNAPILLADEPTANLDSVVGAQILQMFRGLAKQENRALVIVTHDHKVREVADRVVKIHDGQLAA